MGQRDAQQTNSENNQSGSVVMQTESQESTSSSSATDPTPLLLCMKIQLLILSILYHTGISNSKFASTRLTALPDLFDSDALENFPAGALNVTCDDRDQETVLVKLGQIYANQRDAEKLTEVGDFAVKTLVDFFSSIPGPESTQKQVLEGNIAWARHEKLISLKLSLETRLVALHLETQQLKRLDDKLILNKVHLLESRVYRGIGNFPKSKAALTSARTSANSIYCPPYLQAQLDLQSGILHAEDKDYKTGYSCFFEVFENLSTNDDPKALTALKYMLLCKIKSEIAPSPTCENIADQPVV
ncbi:26S proteasome regulatory subunit rpn6 [Tulasnella sp. 424]|nr:26S proteasome regulatory subunit rpn6 [Tulasnella sp. 424]